MDLREQILNADDLPSESVPVPEWGVTLHIRSMTGTERDVYDADLVGMRDMPLKDKMRNMRAKLVVLCCVDESGQRVFNDDDVEELGKKSAKVLTRLSDAAQLLNAMGDAQIEEIAKN